MTSLTVWPELHRTSWRFVHSREAFAARRALPNPHRSPLETDRFTPAYASWANPIEAHFGPLRQFTLANSHHRSHPAQTQALHRCLRWRNTSARHPDVLAAQREERARIRSEMGIRWGARPLNTAA